MRHTDIMDTKVHVFSVFLENFAEDGRYERKGQFCGVFWAQIVGLGPKKCKKNEVKFFGYGYKKLN